MKKLLLMALTIAGSLSLTGCVAHLHGGRLHVHAIGCGHTYVNGRWIVVHKRRHKPRVVHVHRTGCGHTWVSGRWVTVHDHPKRPIVHVHRTGCGHHFVGGRWVVVRKQPRPTIKAPLCAHHPGCGHIKVKGRWVSKSARGLANPNR